MSTEVIWHGDEILAKAKTAAKEALHLSGEIVLRVWQETIPWATGDLASTLTVTDMEDGVQVSSSGPYAAAQEFDATLRHPDPTNPLSLAGRKAHAGRDALDDNKENIRALIEAKVTEALR